MRRRLGPSRAEAARPACKRTRFRWLQHPATLRRDERTRLSGLLRLTAPSGNAYLVKEDLRRFWDSRSTAGAAAHLQPWLWRASHARLAPFQKRAQTIRTHREGILAWTKLRVTHGALEGMNTKVQAISQRAFGFRTTWPYIATISHCCAELPLP